VSKTANEDEKWKKSETEHNVFSTNDNHGLEVQLLR